MDITDLFPDEEKGLFYKEEPYTTSKPRQRPIITYSPEYAAYQKNIREKQIGRAKK